MDREDKTTSNYTGILKRKSDANGERHSYATYVSVGISIVVVVLVASELNYGRLVKIFANIDWGWTGLGLMIFVLNYILRTIRFGALIFSSKVSFYSLFSTISLYGTYNYLLPAKSGELTYLYLLNRRYQITLTESTSTLLTARFYDFFVIAMVLPLIVIALNQQLSEWIVYSAIGFTVLFLLTLVGTIYVIRRADFDNDSNRLPNNRLIAQLVDFIKQLLLDIQKVYSGGKYRLFIGLTIAIWLCVYANFYCIVRALGFQISIFQVIVVSMLLVPLTLLPIQGVANLGTHELGWVSTFSIFGFPYDTALNIAVGTHVTLLFFVFILGGLGFVVGLFSPNAKLSQGQ